MFYDVGPLLAHVIIFPRVGKSDLVEKEKRARKKKTKQRAAQMSEWEENNRNEERIQVEMKFEMLRIVTVTRLVRTIEENRYSVEDVPAAAGPPSCCQHCEQCLEQCCEVAPTPPSGCWNLFKRSFAPFFHFFTALVWPPVASVIARYLLGFVFDAPRTRTIIVDGKDDDDIFRRVEYWVGVGAVLGVHVCAFCHYVAVEGAVWRLVRWTATLCLVLFGELWASVLYNIPIAAYCSAHPGAPFPPISYCAPFAAAVFLTTLPGAYLSTKGEGKPTVWVAYAAAAFFLSVLALVAFSAWGAVAIFKLHGFFIGGPLGVGALLCIISHFAIWAGAHSARKLCCSTAGTALSGVMVCSGVAFLGSGVLTLSYFIIVAAFARSTRSAPAVPVAAYVVTGVCSIVLTLSVCGVLVYCWARR